MAKLDELNTRKAAIEENLAEARRQLSVAKPKIDAAEKEFTKAGRPADSDAPSRIAREQALNEYDAANMNYNEHHRLFQAVRGQIMQEETALYGATGVIAHVARIGPPPDVEVASAQAVAEISEKAQAKNKARGKL